MPPPRVSAVIVSYNTCEETLRCVRSLLESVTLPLETIVVDNASTDATIPSLRRDFPQVRIIEAGGNLGFSRANNMGLREARAPYALILNSDAEVRPGMVETLVALLDARPKVGLVGPRTRNSDGRVEVSFGPALTPWAEWRQRRLVLGVKRGRPASVRSFEGQSRGESEPDWVSGACMLARLRALQDVGFFDEGFFLYEEDVDLCLRLRRTGWRVVFTPKAEVLHHLGRSVAKATSRARLEYHRSHLRYYRKYNGSVWTALLRLKILVAGLLGWVSAVGPGTARRERRRFHAQVIGLAADPPRG